MPDASPTSSRSSCGWTRRQHLAEDLAGEDEAGEVVLLPLVALTDHAHGLIAGVDERERGLVPSECLLHESERLVLVQLDESVGDRLQLIHGASSATGWPGPTCVSRDTWSARQRNHPQLTGRASKS